MDGIVRTLRMVLGLGMVAAGTALAAPAGVQFAALWQLSTQPSAPAVVLPPPAPEAMASQPHDPFPVGFSPSQSMAELNRDYVLPPAPAPLPPVAAPPPRAGVDLATAYRSTLEVPPPPLLDGQQPPPLAAGWGAERDGHRPAPVVQPPAAVYVIRDGDDLTGIATRFYGNPAAAAVIWQANRGLLRDPGILPIGATILLPDPDLVAGLTQVGSRSPSIEPASGPANVRAVGQTWPR